MSHYEQKLIQNGVNTLIVAYNLFVLKNKPYADPP